MTQMSAMQQKGSVSWCSVPLRQSNSWNIPSRPLPNSWVRLLEFPNPYSYEEALIMCQHSDYEWVAWIPDHGETILNSNQFCLYQ